MTPELRLTPRSTTFTYDTPGQHLEPSELITRLEDIQRWLCDGLPGHVITAIRYNGAQLEIEVR